MLQVKTDVHLGVQVLRKIIPVFWCEREMCVCVCVCLCESVCVCVCVRERERERERMCMSHKSLSWESAKCLKLDHFIDAQSK